jgi:hypothetical protein
MSDSTGADSTGATHPANRKVNPIEPALPSYVRDMTRLPQGKVLPRKGYQPIFIMLI